MSNLLVGSVADAVCVFIKNMVAIVGLPKSSKMVIDVEFVNVVVLEGFECWGGLQVGLLYMLRQIVLFNFLIPFPEAVSNSVNILAA